MASRKKPPVKRPIESYDHRDKERVNNPPVGLVTPDTDKDDSEKTYAYDPHLDPQLDWAGKAEHTSFEVSTVSLHVHERIDPRSIVEAVRKHNGTEPQLSLFAAPEENPPIRQAIEFYKHRHNWTNRLVAGDSLLVMNSLLEKEGLGGQVQMVYIDPPYGIKYGSNFQPFVNKRTVGDGKDADLTTEPEQIRAFRDTWELGIHSYLSYLRDRLLLARELLAESGSCFVQISDENVHLVRCLMDEVFGVENFVSLITYKTTGGMSQVRAPRRISDYILWYAQDKERMKFHRLFVESEIDTALFRMVEEIDEQRRPMTDSERSNPENIDSHLRPFITAPLHSKSEGPKTPREFAGRKWTIPAGSWRYSADGFKRLGDAGRLTQEKTVLRAIRYFDDFPMQELTAVWMDTGPEINKLYSVQTSVRPLQRCLLMTTDPGDLVFDPTCGSGTTAYVAEQWGRRWITCDTSRVALTLAKQRLMTALYDYYELARPQEGVGTGFKYKTVPHITLRSIANNPDIKEGMTRAQIDEAIDRHAPPETLYDQPQVDKRRMRVTGPFTVEAVPAPAVKSIDEIAAQEATPLPADESIGRSGETQRQGDWRDELMKTGIRGKAGQRISFAWLEPLPGTQWLHVEGETRPDGAGAERVQERGTAYKPERVAVSFGPEHAPLEQRQVAQAIEEAQTLVPRPTIIVFAAFQFDPEASKDIDETRWPGVTLLKAQMNADLLTDDLKKQRASNESFWLIGQPDVEIGRIHRGPDAGKWEVIVHGFDYYNTKSGNVESGGEDQIAVWMLDTDYDGRSLFPRQVFFPMTDAKGGWAKLARNLKAEIDEELIEAYRGTMSLPFELGEHRRIAVKIVDDRGIESLKVIEVIPREMQ